jgi:hypothetical protein
MTSKINPPNSKLEAVVIKLCQNLPFNATLFEQKGLCYNPSYICGYCRQVDKDDYLCHKKTYIPNLEIEEV